MFRKSSCRRSISVLRQSRNNHFDRPPRKNPGAFAPGFLHLPMVDGRPQLCE
jgi:hypothetical protein